jgi:hypothetical protein
MIGVRSSACGFRRNLWFQNQIKIMPVIQTSLPQSASASLKSTALYVYNMSLFLVACLLNRVKEQAVQGAYKTRPEA